MTETSGQAQQQQEQADGKGTEDGALTAGDLGGDGSVGQIQLDHADLIPVAGGVQREVHLDDSRSDGFPRTVLVEAGEPGDGLAMDRLLGAVAVAHTEKRAVAGKHDHAVLVAQAQPQDLSGRDRRPDAALQPGVLQRRQITERAVVQ